MNNRLCNISDILTLPLCFDAKDIKCYFMLECLFFATLPYSQNSLLKRARTCVCSIVH